MDVLSFPDPYIQSFYFWMEWGRARIQGAINSVIGKLEI